MKWLALFASNLENPGAIPTLAWSSLLSLCHSYQLSPHDQYGKDL